MPKKLHIAVIGAGTVAQAVHLPVIRRRWDRFELSALVDISDRRRGESADVFGIEEARRYSSVEELLKAVRAKTVQVDGAVLASDGLHVHDVLALIRRGIPVLVEPPLGFSEDELRELADFERMTGRQLVMMAHPQQYDEAVERLAGLVSLRDLRMLDYETVMPAMQPLYGHAHVTAAAYDLPSETRAARRTSLQKAVEAGSGRGATQRDRDLYVKGLLTGVAHQVAVVRRLYGPITDVVAVRHWPKSVIPGSVEVLAEVGERGPVRLVWHYLPFAPEHTERLEVLSARKRADVELAAASFHDQRSSVVLREKTGGTIVRTRTEAALGQAESLWMAFHAFVTKGEPPVSGIAEAVEDTLLMRRILGAIVEADGRTLDPEPVVAEDAGEDAPDGDAGGVVAEGDTTGAAGADEDVEEAVGIDDAGATDDAAAAAGASAGDLGDSTAAEPVLVSTLPSESDGEPRVDGPLESDMAGEPAASVESAPGEPDLAPAEPDLAPAPSESELAVRAAQIADEAAADVLSERDDTTSPVDSPAPQSAAAPEPALSRTEGGKPAPAEGAKPAPAEGAKPAPVVDPAAAVDEDDAWS